MMGSCLVLAACVVAAVAETSASRELLEPTKRLGNAMETFLEARGGTNGSHRVLEVVDVARSRSSTAARLASVRGGVGWLFFRHFRKAGGTTLKRFFYESMASGLGNGTRTLALFGTMRAFVTNSREGRGGLLPLPAGARLGYVHLQDSSTSDGLVPTDSLLSAIEFGEFPVVCLGAAPPRALFVTCLRDPVARHVSEFWYSGPGAGRVKTRAHRRVEPDVGEYDPLFVAWINATKTSRPGKARQLGPGLYVDNYYVRGLTGSCVPEKKDDRASARVKSCQFGGAYAGGCLASDLGDEERESLAVAAPDLAYARAVLDRFDLVLVLETLAQAPVQDWLKAQFGFGAEVAKLNDRRSERKPQFTSDVLELLRHDNRFDSALYRDALDRAEHTIPGLRRPPGSPGHPPPQVPH